jgi:DNA phosphorothioation-associated putative methyltransferase
MSARPIRTPAGLRASFGSDVAGCRRADERRPRAGDAQAGADAGRRCPVGELRPDARDAHRTAPEALDPRLRVYEGRARADLGAIEGANPVKLHRPSSKVSYPVDPDCDADPHPAPLRSIRLGLRTRAIESGDDAASPNPPALHRKEAFLLPDDPRRPRFDRLTRQEERAGSLDETATIGTRSGRAERLRERGYALRGHRLVRTRPGDGPQ